MGPDATSSDMVPTRPRTVGTAGLGLHLNAADGTAVRRFLGAFSPFGSQNPSLADRFI